MDKPSSADLEFMRQAIRLARIALERGDTPVGSLVVCDGKVIGEGIEAVRSENDPAGHAEIRAIQAACRDRASLHLDGCSLYTTVEPCLMCSFAVRNTRIARVVIGKPVPYIGGVSSKFPILLDPEFPNWNAPPMVLTGVLEEECRNLFVT